MFRLSTCRPSLYFIIAMLAVSSCSDHDSVSSKKLTTDDANASTPPQSQQGQDSSGVQGAAEELVVTNNHSQDIHADEITARSSVNSKGGGHRLMVREPTLKPNDSVDAKNSGAAFSVKTERGPPSEKPVVLRVATDSALPSQTETEDPVAPVFGFTNNVQENRITTYQLDSRSGMLSSVSIKTINFRPISLALHPTKPYLYAADLDNNAVVVFSYDLHTGLLARHSAAKASIVNNDSSAKSSFVSLGPKGRFAYVANQLTNDLTGEFKTSISVLSVDEKTGSLSFISSVYPPYNNWSIANHPGGQFTYIPSYNHSSITTYSIEEPEGPFTKVGATSSGAGPSSVTISPDGRFAYSANLKSNSVSAFSVDSSSGQLTLVSNESTRTVNSEGNKPLFIEMHPSGKFAYTANYGSGSISVFSINAETGAPTARSSVDSAVAPGTQISSLTCDPSGQYLYAMTPGSGIWIFAINEKNGSLTEIARDVGQSDLRIIFTKALP